jgi:cytochrome P450
VRAVLSDPRFSRAQTIGRDIPRVTQEFPMATVSNLLSMDPPDHTRLRRIGARAFSARSIARCEPYVRRIVDDSVQRLVDAGPPT